MFRIIAAIGAIQALSSIVNLLRSKMLAVMLGPNGVGVISFVDQIVQLITYVCALSLPFAAVKFLSRSQSRGTETFRRSYSSFLKALLLLTTFGALVGLGIVTWRSDLIGPELASYQLFLVPALLTMPAMALQGFFSSVLAAAGRARASALMTLVIAALLAGSTYLGISTGGILGYYLGSLLVGLLVTAGLTAYLWKRLDLPPLAGGHSIRQELRDNPDVVGFSIVLYATTITYSLSFLVSRYAVLSSFGEREAGLLQAGIALFTALNLVLGPANGLFLTPIVNRDIPIREKLQASLEFARKLMLLVGMLAMPMVLFPDWVVLLLFSPAFSEVSRVIFVFVLAQSVLQMAGVHQALLIGLDDVMVYGIITAAGYLLVGGMAWLLVPMYGISGAAFGFLAGASAIFGLTFARLSRRHQLAVSPGAWTVVGYVLLALLLAGAASSLLSTDHPAIAAGKLIVYGLFVLSLTGFLTRDELQQLTGRIDAVLPLGWSGRPGAVGQAYRRIAAALFRATP